MSLSLFANLSGADISSCGRYRYRLWRWWGEGAPCNFIMLNPSTADGEEDDPTIRRCINFAKAWGYPGLMVTNLFALRATDPRVMLRDPDPVGEGNDTFIRCEAQAAGVVVCAWGAHNAARANYVKWMLRQAGIERHYLRLTKNGQPCHPLYLPANLNPQKWGD